ncbi:MAG: GPW/gp25 family protein [Leptolyngbyaceae cyanobacterium MO_188.B28]|nr:GPW/gp25 family protein [Leptolyngbyaceae cyanobacterium MO_188.B28]
MENTNKAYLGTGWGFPPSFFPNGQVSLVSAEEDICESLQILLSTSLGERVMQPTYGCNLQDLVFETLTPTVASSIKERVRTAILYHEPRINLDRLDLTMDRELEGIVLLTVEYTVLSTNSRFNLVYPFYLNEGSGILPAAAPRPASLSS